MISVAPALGNAIQQAVGALLLHLHHPLRGRVEALRKKEPIDNWITKTPTVLPFRAPRTGFIRRTTRRAHAKAEVEHTAGCDCIVLACRSLPRSGTVQALPSLRGQGPSLRPQLAMPRSAGLRVIVVTRKEDERISALLGAEVTVVRNA